MPKELTRDERQIYVRPKVYDLLRSSGPILEAGDKLSLFDMIATKLRWKGELEFEVERQDVSRAVRWLVAAKRAKAGHIYKVPDGVKVYRVNLIRS